MPDKVAGRPRGGKPEDWNVAFRFWNGEGGKAQASSGHWSRSIASRARTAEVMPRRLGYIA